MRIFFKKRNIASDWSYILDLKWFPNPGEIDDTANALLLYIPTKNNKQRIGCGD